MSDIQIYEGLQKPVQMFEDIKAYINQNNILQVNFNDKVVENCIDMKECCFFKLTSLTYDDEYPHREAFENVLSTIDNPSFNFVYILSGDLTGIDIYVGVVKNYNNELDTRTHAVNYGRMIEASFKGNFQGSSLEKLSREDIQSQIIDPISRMKRTSLITGVPSINKNEDGKDADFQGIDRLINSMSGVNWRLAIVCEPVTPSEVQDVKDEIYAIYEKLHRFSKLSMQYSDNINESISKTKSNSDSNSKSNGTNESSSKGRSNGGGSSSTNSSESWATNTSKSESKSVSHSEGSSSSKGKSASMTVEVVNKKIQETLKYLDEELLERMKLGNGKGLFKSSIYAMADNLNNLDRLKSSISSVFQGDKSSLSPLSARIIDESIEDIRVKMLSNFQSYTAISNVNPEIPMLYGHPVEGNDIGLSTYMTAKELSLIAGLPMKEVPGLELKEGVEFGLNINKTESSEENNKIMLGHIIHRGQVLHNNSIHITKDSLNKHLFVAGVTGSGKTTTCQKLLIESEMPFWVIEPAKTEYRELYGKKNMEDIVFFTLGNEKLAPFRFNPFEILEGESITSHVDMLKATFTTAFPMEASMPQILEEAIYECYKKYGWDIDNDTNKYSENPWDENGLYFPTISDLVQVMQEVVKTKKFGQELQANYIGSLVSRISNLTVGSKGQMLNCKLSMNFNELLDRKVVLEMDALKSPEDKSLLMGFILSRMSEALKIRHKKDKSFRHITLVEEAHRLLSKVEYGDSGSKKVSVEMFTDLLAEVRKYGESLIIADQIPNKLAVEVLKNTNTKIIHKLFAKDDKEAIGDTMLMDDKQKQYLSSLQTGEAIVFSEGWNKPIHIKIDRGTDTSSGEVDDEVIKNIGENQKTKFKTTYFPHIVSENIDEEKYKEIMKLKLEFGLIIDQLKRSKLTSDSLSTFNEKLTDVKSKIEIEESIIWRQLMLIHVINSGILRDNFSRKNEVIGCFNKIYDDFLAKGNFEAEELSILSNYFN
jgi:hypothetical protein